MDPAAETPGSGAGAAQSDVEADRQDIENNKDLAAFSYLWIMSVVVYIARRNSPFIRYHSKQAMVLFLLSLIVWFMPFINRLLELIVLGGMVLGFLHAAQGQRKDVPLVGPLSRGEITIRQAWQQLVDWIAGMGRAAQNSRASKTKNQASQPTSSRSSTPSPASSSVSLPDSPSQPPSPPTP